MPSRIASDEFEGALRAAGVGVWIFEIGSGRVRWSDETHRILGFAPGTFPGTFDAYRALVHPEDLAATDASISEAIATCAQDFRTEHRVRRADGAYVCIEGRGGVLTGKDGRAERLIGTVVDVTARRQAEEALRQSEEQHRLFNELASDYVYSVEVGGPNLTPSIVAGSFERTTGFTPEEVGDKGGWMQVIHPEDREVAYRIMGDLMRGQSVLNEYRIIDGAGRVRWLRDRVVPIMDPATGRLRRLIGSVTEITDRKQLEAQLLQAQKLEALARLAGGVAHDFNNLLMVIFSSLDSVRRAQREGTPPSEEAVDSLEQSARRGVELTRSLLAFGRKQVSVRQVVDLRAALHDAMSIVERAATGAIKLCVAAGDTPTHVAIDTGQLQLVLLNLTINARDAMPDGGALTFRVGTVELGEQDRRRPAELVPGRWAVLAVTDTGVGMDVEVRRRLFEPFFTTKPNGNGLGLASAHGIVRELGGTITVESAPGAGSTFTIYLPLLSGPLELTDPGVERASLAGTEVVAVVDDDPSVRAVIAQALRARGYRLREFDSAEAILAQPEEVLAGLDLVISDVRMPGVDGVELCRRLSEMKPGLRFLLVSGYVEDARAQDVLSSGVFAFLEKPFTAEGLARRVREALAR